MTSTNSRLSMSYLFSQKIDLMNPKTISYCFGFPQPVSVLKITLYVLRNFPLLRSNFKLFLFQSPTSPGAVSPGGGSVSPATGGLSPASGSPVGATVPLATTMHHQHDHSQLYDIQVYSFFFAILKCKSFRLQIQIWNKLITQVQYDFNLNAINTTYIVCV